MTAARRVVSPAVRGGVFYGVAGLCLVALAGYLRFRGLSDHSLWFDEAGAAINSRGELWEVLANTRNRKATPILYPLILYAVQLVESTAFSVRAVPAAAGTMTVAVLVFLLPRVGVARPAAFLAGLMLAISYQAIRLARDAKEYSVDALLAVLMIAGLLKYTRDGKRVFLCVALLTAPLLQYGLVLFGIGVLVVAALFAPAGFLKEPPGLQEDGLRAEASDNRRRAVWSWLSKRTGLLLPGGCFLAACAFSWWLTLRFQWRKAEGGFSYLAEYYFQGEYAVGSVVEFTSSQTLRLLDYHLPKEIWILVAVAAFVGVLVFPPCRKLCFSPVVILFFLAIAISNLAALLVVYPLGPIDHNIYLSPVIFLAVASVFHATAYLPAQSLRSWLAPALLVAALVAVAYVGEREIRIKDVRSPRNPVISAYENHVTSALDILDEQVRPGDLIYVDYWGTPVVRFYQGQDRENFIYGEGDCGLDSTAEECLIDALRHVKPQTKRLWMLHTRTAVFGMLQTRTAVFDYESLELVHPGISVEQRLDSRGTYLWVIANPRLLKESQTRLAEIVPGLDASLID